MHISNVFQDVCIGPTFEHGDLKKTIEDKSLRFSLVFLAIKMNQSLGKINQKCLRKKI